MCVLLTIRSSSDVIDWASKQARNGHPIFSLADFSNGNVTQCTVFPCVNFYSILLILVVVNIGVGIAGHFFGGKSVMHCAEAARISARNISVAILLHPFVSQSDPCSIPFLIFTGALLCPNNDVLNIILYRLEIEMKM